MFCHYVTHSFLASLKLPVEIVVGRLVIDRLSLAKVRLSLLLGVTYSSIIVDELLRPEVILK